VLPLIPKCFPSSGQRRPRLIKLSCFSDLVGWWGGISVPEGESDDVTRYPRTGPAVPSSLCVLEDSNEEDP
jgi:hypothetical protein